LGTPFFSQNPAIFGPIGEFCGFFFALTKLTKGDPLNYVTLAASSVLVVLLALLLAREMRIRRALQKLLSKLLAFWRNRDLEKPAASRGDDNASGGDGLH
jgi:hypothetical protein